MSLEQKMQDIENEKTSLSGALKKLSAWEWAKSAASNAFGAYLSGGILGYGALNVLTTMASFLTANYLLNGRKGFTKKSVQSDINFSGWYTPSLSALLKFLDKFAGNPLKWMAGYAISMPAFTAATNAMKYMVEKYSPASFIKGIFKGEPIKDVKYIAKDATTNSAKSGAKSALYLTLPVAASRYLLPRELLIASLFPLRTAYKYITGRQDKKLYNSLTNYSYPIGMISPHMQAV